MPFSPLKVDLFTDNKYGINKIHMYTNINNYHFNPNIPPVLINAPASSKKIMLY